MDFKGITWVENVYQKFEAMCLEVEEIIVQDTAKYVENQVKAVGNSVKRFCSDVVQDLRSDEYAHVCSSLKKKRESMKQEEEDVTEGKKDGFAMELRGVDADDYDICTSPRQSSSGGPYRRTRLGRKQGFKKEVTRTYIQKDSTSCLSMVLHRTRLRNGVGTVKTSDPHPPGEVARLISKEECHRSDIQPGLAVVNSVRSQDTEIRTKDEHGLAVANSVRSQDSLIQPCIAISLPAGSVEQKSVILQELSGRSVEQSCIIVDRDELHCVFPDKEENNKHKPYKKIRDAISSRMKQNREQEYKRLARQWYVEDVENPRLIEEDQSSEESEWELL
ncbi:hypothetical protein N665_0104s0045 [Sinapis alba]|nr:hypothetical protein N665_0104s0045 [Sinapis alba]KAF8108722.1 hypothetical protein N665_0104s0045 [Sinapis alba]